MRHALLRECKESKVHAMKTLFTLGRFFFAFSLVAFGIQYFLSGRFLGGLPIVSPWVPGGPPATYLAGTILIAAGIGIVTERIASFSATLLGSLILLCVLLLHGLRATAIFTDGVTRTRAFEALALGSAALFLAPALPRVHISSQSWRIAQDRLAQVGRCVFALSMAMFGAQHFKFATFIATLVPSWIPGHLFWAYFTGAAMLAAAVAIAATRYAHLAAASLGIMFLLWVLLLHAPRVATQIQKGDEWTSAFVALALCRAGFAGAEVFKSPFRYSGNNNRRGDALTEG